MLVVPNAQVVLRTLLLVLPELRPAATLEGLLCDAGALDVSRWVDPVVVAWLCEPDLPEEQQRLAALYAKHLPAAAAEAATRAAEKDGEAELRAAWQLLEQLYQSSARFSPPEQFSRVVAREMKAAYTRPILAAAVLTTLTLTITLLALAMKVT